VKVSIVVVTCNSAQTLRRCLDSALAQSGIESEVWVVDNGSQDATADILRSYGSSVRVIFNRSNVGAARARNQAIRKVRGEWVLALDPDAWLSSGFLAAFSREAKVLADKRVGMVAPTILFPDGQTIYAVGHRVTPLRRFYDEGRGRPLGSFRLRPGHLWGPCSAAAFYRRAMLEDIVFRGAYFDESFFFMVEDVDLSWRARQRRWDAIWMPSCVCFHKGGGAGVSQSEKDYYSIRNRFLMMAKNDFRWRVVIWSLPLSAYEIARFLRLCLRGQAGMYARACRDAAGILKEKKRRGR
jgi:hypothetical protein